MTGIAVHPSKRLRRTRGDAVFGAVNTVFIALSVLVTLYPLLYVLSASISDPNKVNSGAMWLWPVDVTFLGYRKVFSNPDIWSGYRNTIYYTVFGTLINLALTLPCAYALAKKRLPLKKLINFIILFTMFFSGGLIPLYMLVNGMQLLDTVWAVVLPTAASAYNIIIARTFMETTIPEGLEEAAEIDGCDPFRTFFRIILPLSSPIIAVMALFYGVGHWNPAGDPARDHYHHADDEQRHRHEYGSADAGADAAACRRDQVFRHDRIDAADHPRVPVFAAVFCEGRHDRFDQGVSKARPFRK